MIPSLELIVCWIDGFDGKPAFRYFDDGRERANAALKLLLAALEPQVEGGGA